MGRTAAIALTASHIVRDSVGNLVLLHTSRHRRTALFRIGYRLGKAEVSGKPPVKTPANARSGRAKMNSKTCPRRMLASLTPSGYKVRILAR